MAIGTVAAILGASVIGAGASIFAGAKAEKAQKKATAQGLAAQKAQYEETKSMLAPYSQAGESALDLYGTAVGLKGKDAQKGYFDDFQTDPGWLAAQEAGLSAVDDKYRLGGSSGGNVRAALYDYGQRNMLSAYDKRLSQLGGLVDTGRGAASSLAGFSSNFGNAQSSLLSQAASGVGQGVQGAGNAIAGGLSSLAGVNLFNQGLSAGRGGGNSWDTFTTNYARI